MKTVARHLSYGDALLQVSLVPESRYRYVFPLTTEMPAYLVRSRNPYLDSLLYKWIVGSQRTPSPSAPLAITADTSPDSATASPRDP